ncbi:GNAT family N-acetyltransferase [Mucilaginibacter sp. HMF5004]|uniref:GNAT family N-acetyltransferase n=1 Tax=Mucilaginibacter rivuli TaxID=2857527 RepID=UPI001C5F4D5C|nr:GNAT family protein [Mucilaginibacter rivuli]MBW4889310.1 GNAT family N-acetyltransferase [Mucilaginibacter rivuli]
MPLTFNKNKEYILEDERVLLRPLQESDIDNLLPFAKNEPDLWQFSLRSAATKAGMEKYINDALIAKAAGTEYPFIVFDKQTNQYAGCTRFYDIQIANSMLQLGYTWYGKAFWGTGLNKHCKYLLLQFAFEQLAAERVEFRADNNNTRSKAAMQSIGCKVEGVLRSHAVTATGARRDSIILSILKNEWESDVKQNLESKL